MSEEMTIERVQTMIARALPPVAWAQGECHP